MTARPTARQLLDDPFQIPLNIFASSDQIRFFGSPALPIFFCAFSRLFFLAQLRFSRMAAPISVVPTSLQSGEAMSRVR
jgi:hypothetical protein